MKHDPNIYPRASLRGASAVIREGFRTAEGPIALAFFVILFGLAVIL
jgi:hypothetical protein